jgi:hypothetical protein
MIEQPTVEDTIGKKLVHKNEFQIPSISLNSQRYSYQKQKLYVPKKRGSIESVRHHTKGLRVKPIFWCKTKKPLLTQRQIDTKGIGLMIKPPVSFLKT